MAFAADTTSCIFYPDHYESIYTVAFEEVWGLRYQSLKFKAKCLTDFIMADINQAMLSNCDWDFLRHAYLVAKPISGLFTISSSIKR